MTWLLGFLNGGLLVAITVLAIHDHQTIATLKRQHQRLKVLESRPLVQVTTGSTASREHLLGAKPGR